MKTLGIDEARAALADLESWLQAEGEIEIMRDGRVIARLLPDADVVLDRFATALDGIEDADLRRDLAESLAESRPVPLHRRTG